MKRFAGKVALVTGGTSGIGLAIARGLLAEGASVAVCARSQDALDVLAPTHPAILVRRADVTDPEDRELLLDSIRERFGELDILVNNAGRLIERDFTAGAGSDDGLAAEIALNLTAPIQLSSAALARWPSLGAIVFVTSGYALVSPRRAPTYGAAKAGLRGFANGLRHQLAPHDTHVLEVLPPVVDTPATAHRRVKKVPPEAVAAATLDALAKRKPLALVGPTKFLPMMLRLTPGIVDRMVSAT